MCINNIGTFCSYLDLELVYDFDISLALTDSDHLVQVRVGFLVITHDLGMVFSHVFVCVRRCDFVIFIIVWILWRIRCIRIGWRG